jgi:cytochrome P450
VIATFPNLYYISQRLHLPLFREVITRVDNVRSYAQESIERYDRLVATDPHNVKPTLLTKLFRASEKDEETMSQEELICNAQAFIVAGSDTTAHTMTYLVWLLCKPENIDLKNRLLAEIATLPNEFHNEDLKSLMFLDCIIQETLRLFSAAPAGLPRDVLKGGCEIDGIWVAEGTVVTMQAYSMHRDPVVFPQPERWATVSFVRDNKITTS